jgi:hypothetical protein
VDEVRYAPVDERARLVTTSMARKDRKSDGRRNNGGRREGAGRPPGPAVPSKYKMLRDLACTYTEEAFEAILRTMRTTKDEWLRFACANAVLDRGHGKPREHGTFEAQEVIALQYPTLEEIKADLIARGLPIEHLLEVPKLIEHDPKR